MNKERREKLRRINRTIQECMDEVEFLRDAEDEAMGNVPENMWDSDRYLAMEDAVGYLEEAHASMEEAANLIDSAIAS